MTLIDTSSWIEQLRKGGDIAVRDRVERLLSTGEAAWCSMVRLELCNGARGDAERQVLADMERALPSLAIDEEVWNHAISLAAQAREQGVTVPATDLLVWSCAAVHRIDVEHNDRHFHLLGRIGKA